MDLSDATIALTQGKPALVHESRYGTVSRAIAVGQT